MKIRRPAVAGRFYPGTQREIVDLLNTIYQREKLYIKTKLAMKNIIGAVVPHAGYIYSGYQAIHFFEIIKKSFDRFETIFIINPNHKGYGEEIALDSNDFWETPMGKVAVDKDFVNNLDFPVSDIAHEYEHSGEVMLPYLQNSIVYPFEIVPITMSRQSTENAKRVANAIFEANKKVKKRILIIASSDFSHYVSPKEGSEKDKLVTDKILKFDTEGVDDVVAKNHISVCGYGPIMALMEYAKLVSESPKNEILAKGHSGQVVPSDEVVNYYSMLFYED